MLAKPVLCFFEWKSQLYAVKFIDNTDIGWRGHRFEYSCGLNEAVGDDLKKCNTGIEHSLYWRIYFIARESLRSFVESPTPSAYSEIDFRLEDYLHRDSRSIVNHGAAEREILIRL